jgi:repressor LexA
LFAYEPPVLTPRQKQVLDFVTAHIDRHGVAPTLHDIGRHLKLSSVATVHAHLRKLEEKGAVRRLAHRSRALAVVPASTAAAAQIPLLGTVAAGAPIEPIEIPDTLAVPDEMLGRGETFALRVRGDSMIDDGIRDGDLLVVESRQDAEDGATVVATVRGEATVKKLRRRRGQVHLVPANAAMAPIVARADEVEIRGVVVALLRRYRT